VTETPPPPNGGISNDSNPLLIQNACVFLIIFRKND
jgi:hypothetical protein